MTYKLHCFAQSGNAYKPALYLELAGADWAPIFIDFMRGAHREADYTALNEMREVPCLEHEGQTLSQSGVILDYLVEKIGKFGWADSAERREVLRWILWDNHKFSGMAAPLRFITTFLPPEKRSEDVVGFLTMRFTAALKTLDARLADRDWVATDGPSIADLSICGYLFYGDELPVDLAQFPNITAWLDRIRALPGWKHPHDLMPGHPLPGSS